MFVILIKGISNGIGLANALHSARKGHGVYASQRNPDGATELRQGIGDERLPVMLVPIDVEDDASRSTGKKAKSEAIAIRQGKRPIKRLQ